MKISETPLLKELPILPTPTFLKKKSEPLPKNSNNPSSYFIKGRVKL